MNWELTTIPVGDRIALLNEESSHVPLAMVFFHENQLVADLTVGNHISIPIHVVNYLLHGTKE